jgi:glycosyltransferase involved in cell wall biosynthesis
VKIAILAARSSIHTTRWVNALAERGHEIHLISAHRGGDELDRRLSLHPLPLPAPAGYILNVPWLRKLLKTVRPDVLHAHYASGYGTLGRLSGFQPFLLSVWGSDVYDFPFKSPVHRWLVTRNLEAASWICSTSRVMARQTEMFLEEARRLSVIPFGVESSVFAPRLPAGSRNLITVGTVKTLAPKYAIDVLIRAFAAARQGLTRTMPELAEKLRLLIVGGGPEREALETLTDRLSLTKVVEFAGAVPHSAVPSYLNRLDVYVAASRTDSESFGVAVLEASACARPVVVSDAGGLPEVVLDGVTGLVVERENVSATADAILRLITDASLRRRMGQAGRRYVLEHYEWSDNVAQMESIYCRVVESHVPSSRVTSPY